MAAEKYSGSVTYELLKGQLPAGTTIKEKTVTLSGGVDRILEVNPRRLAFIVTNLSSSIAYLSNYTEILTVGGLALMGSGATLSMVWNEDFEAVSAEYFAKGDVGTKLYIMEIIAL